MRLVCKMQCGITLKELKRKARDLERLIILGDGTYKMPQNACKAKNNICDCGRISQVNESDIETMLSEWERLAASGKLIKR
jgi:hypothetical protein